MNTRVDAVEASAGFGAAVGTVGIGLWVLQLTVGIFASWGWALLIGSAWMVLGALLLFPDVRVYTGARSPAEAYYAAESTVQSSTSDTKPTAEPVSESSVRD